MEIYLKNRIFLTFYGKKLLIAMYHATLLYLRGLSDKIITL